MMPNSSQVHDHQLIFQIISGVGQFYHWQNKGEEVRVCQIKSSCWFPKNIAATTKHRGVGEVEVVGEERRGGQTKIVSIYSSSRSSINSSTTVVLVR